MLVDIGCDPSLRHGFENGINPVPETQGNQGHRLISPSQSAVEAWEFPVIRAGQEKSFSGDPSCRCSKTLPWDCPFYRLYRLRKESRGNRAAEETLRKNPAGGIRSPAPHQIPALSRIGVPQVQNQTSRSAAVTSPGFFRVFDSFLLSVISDPATRKKTAAKKIPR